MNILFLSLAVGCDYQCDMVFHGLRSILGQCVVDYPHLLYMYSDYQRIEHLYGRGFTLYGLLDPIPIDRTYIREKIRDHYFDLIIYGSIHRYQQHLDLVLAHYKKHEILFIDGEDQSHVLYDFPKAGLYFKRELAFEHPDLHPLHFAIPREKIGTLKDVPKSKVRAFIDPRDRSTYVYSHEASYYKDYASSLFAFTTKKAGWDCLRHYEIMANSAIPLFLDLEQCPHTTCMQLPKPELLEALTLMDYDGKYWDTPEGRNQWLALHRRIHIKFACHSTTERLAQYVLETQRIEATRAA
jgi:hypothetical protein